MSADLHNIREERFPAEVLTGTVPSADIESSVGALDLRQRRAIFVRYAVVVGLIAITANTLQNLAIFEAQRATHYVFWAIALGANLLTLFFWAGSKYYAAHRWIDVIIALPIILMMDGLRRVDSSQAELFGFIPAATLMGDSIVAVAFVSTFFAGNFRGYAVWCIAHALCYYYFSIEMGASGVQIAQASSFYVPILVLSLYLNWAIEREGYKNLYLRVQLEEEKAKSEILLYNVLPEEVAQRLRRGEAIADAYSDATVVFVDIVGSSSLARALSPRHFVAVLNDVFSLADNCAERHGVEKVKTIGDAYLAITGGRAGGNAVGAVCFALEMAQKVRELAQTRQLSLDVRVGIHTGPVVGGIIGETRATYDYWGDTMNVAARVQGAADAGGVTTTEPTYFATREHVPYRPPRMASLKGIGDVKVFDVAL